MLNQKNLRRVFDVVALGALGAVVVCGIATASVLFAEYMPSDPIAQVGYLTVTGAVVGWLGYRGKGTLLTEAKDDGFGS